MIDQHKRIDLLLPWHVSGALDLEESEQVRRHLANCVTCRGQLRDLEELSTFVGEAATPSFDTASHLLEAEYRLATIKRRDSDRPSRSSSRSNPLRWLLLSQVAGLVLVATLLVLRHAERPQVQPSHEPLFRTLSESPSSVTTGPPRVRILFSEGITEQRIRTLLHQAGGRIVDGPSAVGLYVVELDPRGDDSSSLASRLEALRTHEGVRFAELEEPLP